MPRTRHGQSTGKGKLVTFIIKTDGLNSDEIEFWNGPQGKNWVKQNELTDFMYDPFGAKAIERADIRDGERVIDVGCGCGKTTGKLADLVAPGGRVTALDVSVPMLEIARNRITSNAGHVDFISADAATYAFERESYDVIYSQFVLMFFLNPEEAFSNLFRALKPGGRVAFVCWRRPELNPFLMIPFEAVRSFVPDMPVPSPDVPASPFSLAPEGRVRNLLADAGIKDVQLEEFDFPTRMGQGDLEACLSFVADFSNPVATALRRTEPAKAPEILDAVRTAVAPYYTGETLKLPPSAWIVSARRPL
jgi:SAM-dependent methyltransferase